MDMPNWYETADRERRLKRARLLSKGYPVRISTQGGFFWHWHKGSLYRADTLEQAVITAVYFKERECAILRTQR